MWPVSRASKPVLAAGPGFCKGSPGNFSSISFTALSRTQPILSCSASFQAQQLPAVLQDAFGDEGSQHKPPRTPELLCEHTDPAGFAFGAHQDGDGDIGERFIPALQDSLCAFHIAVLPCRSCEIIDLVVEPLLPVLAEPSLGFADCSGMNGLVHQRLIDAYHVIPSQAGFT